MAGPHTNRHWSATRTTNALSSGEAELVGIVRGATHGLGFQSMAKDLGFHYNLDILTDATAAIGIVRRRGLGRIRHLDVADLWVQEKLRANASTLSKILGSANPADICTKHVPKPVLDVHLPTLNLAEESGRAQSAPSLQH